MIKSSLLLIIMKPTIEIILNQYSQHHFMSRDLYVCLPFSYYESDAKYPVIYMQDGQNLFDGIARDSANWRVDRVLDSLNDIGLDAVIVGIPNIENERWNEYSPFLQENFGGGSGDAYIEFLLGTVKPLIDNRYRTFRSRECTGIFGSSMGGFISLYAYFAYPKEFGFVGAMSPALWFGSGALLEFVGKSGYVPGRIYLDVGGQEFIEEDVSGYPQRNYVRNARHLKEILLRKGYVTNQSIMYIEDTNGMHHETDWNQRLPRALKFLLGWG